MREEKNHCSQKWLINLLIDRTKSMVEFTIFVLSFVVKDEFPNSNV